MKIEFRESNQRQRESRMKDIPKRNRPKVTVRIQDIGQCHAFITSRWNYKTLQCKNLALDGYCDEHKPGDGKRWTFGG